MKKIITVLLFILLAGCTSYPASVKPVSNFELKPYLGKWYEIARLDHNFERGLSKVTAEYSIRKDGGIRVINRGYSSERGWKEVIGKADFVNSPNKGYLKVSFFGPLYGAYVIFDVDPKSYAFVSG